ncbi:hypothetical protein NDU88_006510 [Pleurodeles waltl]|uniref:Uncharacterized protein n=1 Tax=Pleurodeles waltl TaxID=8319 RepID=A0AAV7VM40_PLEWA|nr:hypothetical protein NDU88_006510 [Pleurodeles waltl]
MQNTLGLNQTKRRGEGVGKKGDLIYFLRSGKRSPSLKGNLALQIGPSSQENVKPSIISVETLESRGNVDSSLIGEVLLDVRSTKTALKKSRITPSLRTYFKVLPGTQRREKEMEEEEHENFALTSDRRSEGIQALLNESTPDRFQSQMEENLVQNNYGGVPNQEVELNSFKRAAIGQEQDLWKGERQGRDDDLQQKAVATPSEQTPSERPLTQSIAGMIWDLAIEIRGSFETSNSNQKEIRGLCEALGQKFDDLVLHIAALEAEVSELKKVTENNAEAIQRMKAGEDKGERIKKDNAKLVLNMILLAREEKRDM